MKQRFESFDSLESDQDFSLTVVRATGAITLGRKTRGFGRGKLVLPGGAEMLYQNRAQNAVREVEEELGLCISGSTLTEAGTISIMDMDVMEDITLHLTIADLPERVPVLGSEELTDVDWYANDSLPYGEMPEDYGLWLPAVLTDAWYMGASRCFSMNKRKLVR